METELNYRIFAKKYKLPNYKELNFEFEISSIEDSDFLLRDIRKKIIEKIESFIKLFEDIIHPETSLSSMYECKILDDKTKDEIIKLYKELMLLKRKSDLISINNNEKELADFINYSFEKWKSIKPKLLKILNLLLLAWKKDIDVKEDLFYLG